MHSINNNKAFTLVELLVALVVLSLLIVSAMPSYNHFKSRREINLKAWEIRRSLELARSLAMSQQEIIKVCIVDDLYKCIKEQGNKLTVFRDTDNNSQWSFDEDLYRDITLGGLQVMLSVSAGRRYIRFKGNGESRESGNLFLCSVGLPDFGRRVVVFHSGRVRLSRNLSDDDRKKITTLC